MLGRGPVEIAGRKRCAAVDFFGPWCFFVRYRVYKNTAALNNSVLIGVTVRSPFLVWIPYELLSTGGD
jgi:hypothetical protein